MSITLLPLFSSPRSCLSPRRMVHTLALMASCLPLLSAAKAILLTVCKLGISFLFCLADLLLWIRLCLPVRCTNSLPSVDTSDVQACGVHRSIAYEKKHAHSNTLRGASCTNGGQKLGLHLGKECANATWRALGRIKRVDFRCSYKFKALSPVIAKHAIQSCHKGPQRPAGRLVFVRECGQPTL